LKLPFVLVIRKRSFRFPGDVRLQRAALRAVLSALKRHGLRVTVAERSSAAARRRFGLVVSVGGDGTFLEAARGVREALALGVNSNPGRSVGSFCAATARTFPAVLKKVLAGEARIIPVQRLQLRINRRPAGPPVLNEVLVTHRKPAAMSRYWLRIGRVREEHRSSGLWIATAAGSTGAILSAGGRKLPRHSRQIQVRPRELYQGLGARYRLRGGVIPPGRRVAVGSRMEDGMVCIDGEHITFPFRAGDRLDVAPFPQPLRLVIS